MKLIRLELRNFKGCRSFVLETNGGDVSVFGDNGTYKTTLYDAFLWLLFDKDSQNRKDFDVKTLDAKGEVMHGLDHSVEATFEVNGKQLNLKKVYSESWTKKRGSAEKQFTGHTIDHFVDKVPVKKGEFGDRIADIVDEDAFKLLTNPKYFNEQLHWQKRRQLLLEVCGDISDADVIASDAKLAKLPGILGERTLDDHRKVIAARRAEINRELERIPVRIDEVTQGLPVLIGDAAKYKNDIAALQEIIDGKEKQRREIQAGGGAAELQVKLSELSAKMLELKTRLREEQDAELEPAREEKNRLTGEMITLEAEIAGYKKQIELGRVTEKELSDKTAALRQKWYEVDAKTFEYKESDTCPTCGQSLPADQVEAAREKASAQFNQDKAEQLADISKRGQDAKADLDAQAEKLAQLEAALPKSQEALSELLAKKEKLTVIAAPKIDIEGNPEYLALQEEKKALQDKMVTLEADKAEALTKIDSAINDDRTIMRANHTELAKFDQHAAGEKRIAELKAQERELAAEYENLEQELYLTEQFVRSKVKLLEEKINSRFKMARFKLFSVQINGGIEECCDTLYQGVPYSSLNNGARINVGLDVINTLSAHYQFECPIFIDNKEAVTQLIDVSAQVIALVVSEQDKQLRVEGAAQKVKEAV